MKAFIVFLALLTVCGSGIFFQADMGRYMQAQVALKQMAEECAAGAALYFDEEFYAMGHMVFRQEEGLAWIDYLLRTDVSRLPARLKGPLQMTCDFFDDSPQTGDTAEIAGLSGQPAVRVRLTADIKDLFRLPFLCVERIEREAVYALPARS